MKTILTLIQNKKNLQINNKINNFLKSLIFEELSIEIITILKFKIIEINKFLKEFLIMTTIKYKNQIQILIIN
jgi:hypothetical protein